jgi:(E)-4-hydroxy-3-methylbut-2-enyl-diphosphate synthase
LTAMGASDTLLPVRRKTRAVKEGKLIIGGGFPVSVQTMWKEALRREDIPAVLLRLEKLGRAGCDLVRFAVPDLESADILGTLATRASMPLVADIHFDYRIAMRCLDHPIAKIRINPGTMGQEDHVREVIGKCRDRGVSLRIGVNAGSLPEALRGIDDRAMAMVTAAEIEMECLDKLGFHDVVFSLKSSDVDETVSANRNFSKKYEYPLHIGVTEAGPLVPGIVRNTLGISSLLAEGIGDTVRVSLSAASRDEILAGVEILRESHVRERGVRVISCPQCGRASFDVHVFLEQASFFIQEIDKPLTIAVMGCPVNGPGEARDADIGITGAGGMALIFRKGKVERRVAFDVAEAAFCEEIQKVCTAE